MIEFVDNITEELILQNPDKVFVFGDNLKRSGYGGQAKVCRGRPNTFGIPTKRSPSRDSSAYLTDANLVEMHDILKPYFITLQKILRSGKTVVWPSYGIGTGLADLPTRAPMIYDLIYNWLIDLCDNFGYSGNYLGPKG